MNYSIQLNWSTEGSGQLCLLQYFLFSWNVPFTKGPTEYVREMVLHKKKQFDARGSLSPNVWLWAVTFPTKQEEGVDEEGGGGRFLQHQGREGSPLPLTPIQPTRGLLDCHCYIPLHKNKRYSFGNKGASPSPSPPPSVQLGDQMSLIMQTFFLICMESLTQIIFNFWWFDGPKIIDPPKLISKGIFHS